MTKKDFEVIASILAKVAQNEKLGYAHPLENAKGQIENILQQTNPRFNASTFWQAVQAEVEEDCARYAE